MDGDFFIVIFILSLVLVIIIFLITKKPPVDDEPIEPTPKNRYIPPAPSPKTIRLKEKERVMSSDFSDNTGLYSSTGATTEINTEINTKIESSSMVNKCDGAKKQWLEILDRYKTENKHSRGEILTRRALEQLYGEKFPSVRPNWLKNPRTGYNLELDGYCEKLKMAFEYHGEQHRIFPNNFHKTFEEFKDQVIRDKDKADICEKRGIYLIIVDFTVPHGEIFEYVKRLTPEYRLKH